MTREGKMALPCLPAFLLDGCQGLSRSDPVANAAGFRKPGANEIVNLRSKCAAVGEKIMRGNAIGVASSGTSVALQPEIESLLRRAYDSHG